MDSIKVKLHEGGCMPERHGAFYDLATRREEKLEKGEVRIIPLGVSMVLPNGGWGLLVPRSSTALKWGVIEANSVGVVEPDYCGDDDEWGFAAYAIRDTVIPAGTRICQFAVCDTMGDIECEQVETTGKPNRGGYGSTGEKDAKAEPRFLDADGVEIKVGDVVYSLCEVADRKRARPLKVVRLHAEGSRCMADYDVVGTDMFGCNSLCENFTHEPPDSWEKLLRDIESGDDACSYFGRGNKGCDGCPAEECGECYETMARDMLDRIKRLAGIADE